MVKFLHKKKNAIAGWLIDKCQPHVLIIDDEAANFPPGAIAAARIAGYRKIDRIYFVDDKALKKITEKDRYDVIILDIKGVVHQEIASDGLQLSGLLKKRTSAYLVITSAHQYHLDKRVLKVDRILEDRMLTSVDFISLLDEISSELSVARWKFLRRFGLKIAMAALRSHGP